MYEHIQMEATIFHILQICVQRAGKMFMKSTKLLLYYLRFSLFRVLWYEFMNK